METNSNTQNDNMNEPRPVKAPGFANTSSGAGGASPSRGVNMEDISMGANEGLNKPKKSRSAMIGMIVFALIAACGIGFGVWAMLDGNSRVQKKDEQIKELQGQSIEKKDETVVENDATVVMDEVDNGDGYRNPVIKSDNTDLIYRVGFESSYYYDDNYQNYVMSINLKDGEIDTCSIYKADGAFDSECRITGLNGEIFKVIEFGEGQSNVDSSIGFIMTDGTVQYFPFIEAMKNKDYSIKGQLSINGFVHDAFNINVGASDPNVAGGYGSTVFIIDDGAFLKFDRSMVQ